MLDRFARGAFCRKRGREVRVSIGVVIAQLDRLSIMRDSILLPPFSSERDPESIMEESGAEMGGRLLITAASQGVFKIANRIVDPVAVHGEEREIVIGHITVRRRGERMSPTQYRGRSAAGTCNDPRGPEGQPESSRQLATEKLDTRANPR